MALHSSNSNITTQTAEIPLKVGFAAVKIYIDLPPNKQIADFQVTFYMLLAAQNLNKLHTRVLISCPNNMTETVNDHVSKTQLPQTSLKLI